MKNLVLIGSFFSLLGCSTPPPMNTVEHVDINRFMGDWYVIANIPTFIEKGAHNATESYALNTDGSINTTFTFHQDSFDGPLKTYNPTGYIQDTSSNALWGMEFIWPFKSDYRIIYLDKDYRNTVIGRIKRDYVWIMARTPTVEPEKYSRMLKVIAEQGYDVNLIQTVPQKW